MFWLAPFVLVLCACGTTARGIDKPPPAPDSHGPDRIAPLADDRSHEDPLKLVERTLEEKGELPGWGDYVTGVSEADGLVTVAVDRLANTLSSVEMFMKMCTSLRDVLSTDATPSRVTGLAFVAADGRTITAATSKIPECHTR